MMLQVFLVFAIDDVSSRILWDSLRTHTHTTIYPYMVNLYPLEPRWRKRRRRRGDGERPREPESQSYGHVGPETQTHLLTRA